MQEGRVNQYQPEDVVLEMELGGRVVEYIAQAAGKTVTEQLLAQVSQEE